MKRRRGGGIAVCLSVCLVSASCSSPAAEDAPTTVTTTPSTTTDPRTLAPSQRAHEVGVVFQSGGFLVTLGEVVHDTATGTVYLGLRFKNLTDSWTTPGAEGRFIVDEAEHHVFLGSTVRIPPATAADVTGEVRVGDSVDPLATGTLRWGRHDETTTSVHMSDGAAEGFGPPVDLPVDTWGQIGRFTVHLTSARLMADALRARRAPTGHHVLRLELDEYTSTASPVNGFHAEEHFLLEWPDGTVVEPLGASPGRAPMSWTSSTGHNVDFPVPPDVSGDYQVLFASVGKHAFGLLHPDLVERVSIPLTLHPVKDLGPVAFDGPDTMPRPVLPDSDRSPGSTTVEIEVDGTEVNVSGFAFRAVRLQWDPTTATATLLGEARLMPPVRAPDESFLATPSQFAPVVALASGGRLFGGLAGSVPQVDPGESVPVTYEFRFVDALDVDDLTLYLGRDHMTPSILPLTPGSAYDVDPAVPTAKKVLAPTVTAGNYQVAVVGYRFGLPRELDRPPAGMKALEIIADVTATEVEPPGPFGLGFDTRSQLYLTYADGYLQQADNHEWVELQDGETDRVGATYYVPASWQPGPVVLTVRSIDEIRALTRLEWTEVTFTAEFLEDELKEGTEDDPGI